MTQANGKKPSAPPPIEVSLDMDSYTNEELEQVEDLLPDRNIHEVLLSVRWPPQKVLTGLLWVTMRRADPQVTLETVRAMKASAWTYERTPGPLPESGDGSEQNASPPSVPSTT